MDFDFTSSILAKLPEKERIVKYLQLAAQAENRGELASANQWRQLAAEVDQSCRCVEG